MASMIEISKAKRYNADHAWSALYLFALLISSYNLLRYEETQMYDGQKCNNEKNNKNLF